MSDEISFSGCLVVTSLTLEELHRILWKENDVHCSPFTEKTEMSIARYIYTTDVE